MGFLWFLLALVFFILWLNARSKKNQGDSSAEYGQGYWDGYRAFGDKVARMLAKGRLDERVLQRWVDEGNGGVSRESHHEEMLGRIPENTEEYDDTETTQVSEVLPQSVAPPSQAELEEAKERRTLQNLNTLLYVGSFLIVAAAALFVTLVMPAGVKLASLLLVTASFYVSGLVLYRRSQRLRPAATAFVGTGLAMLPFSGFALTSLGGFSGEGAWFATSLVGLVAYGYAAVRLQSELVSYLTMAFVLSLAMSAVSTLSLPMVWYFIVVIGVSLVCNSIHYLWPRHVPDAFALPVEQTGRLTTPIALGASILTLQYMDLFMYQVLYGLATAHYLVVWLERRRLVYETAVRVLAHLTLLVVGYDVSGMDTWTVESSAAFGVWWLVLAGAQSMYSIVRVNLRRSRSVYAEQLWLTGAVVSIWVGMTWWLAQEAMWAWMSASLVVLLAISLAAMLRLRRAEWGYVGLASSVALMFAVARGVVEPAVPYEVIAGGFVLAAAACLMWLERTIASGRSHAVTSLFSVGVTIYAGCVVLCGMLADSSATLGWTTLLAGAVFIALSYLLKAAAIEIIGAVLGVVAVGAWVGASSLEEQWWLVVVAVMSAALLLVGAVLHHVRGERSRRDALAGFGAMMLASMVLVVGVSADMAVYRTATVVLLGGGVAALALRLRLGQRHAPCTLLSIVQLSYIALPILAFVVSWRALDGWPALVLCVSAGVAWISSWIERQPAALLVGNAALVWALYSLWGWLDFDYAWRLYGVAWLASVVFYGMYWFMVDKSDEKRQFLSLVSIWTVLGVAAWSGIFFGDAQDIMASAGSLLLLAGTVGVHGYLTHRKSYVETSAYLATFGLQRMVEVLIPEANLVFYGHWWALVIALAAWWRSDVSSRTRQMVALGFVTASTGLYALMGLPGYSLLFLVEHLVILTAGALLRRQWAMWWGIVAVVVAVLYFLRGYTFLALLFLGFLLILFVIWRLTKMGKR